MAQSAQGSEHPRVFAVVDPRCTPRHGELPAPALALGAEPPERDVMDRPPRPPHEPLRRATS
ncbi:cation-translocating P-type ATPase C-terminal domain-containing protein [Streptomyces sp. NBC_00400]|uniref:cation-translocating P-type ATPase C-terminal domain-containing protein n=1 Tax=Streptomyces sp. NBC_00400 TaxID=2975737 RepID=UPI003FA68502